MLQRLPIPKAMNRRVVISLLSVILFANPYMVSGAKQTPQCDSKSGQIELTSVRSTVYGEPVPVNVYLPPCYSAESSGLYPVIYLLHGGNADETQWPDLNVLTAADDLIDDGASPFVVVMPGAIYTERINYGTFVLKDMLPSIQKQYRDASGR